MNPKKTSPVFFRLACLFVLCLPAGCGKKEAAEQPSAAPVEKAAPAAAAADPSTLATVSGTVKFEGAHSKAAKIDMSKDPACKGENVTENLVADGGNLANVFVYVKEGLSNRAFDVPAAAVIEQKGCRYQPHVLGVMATQNIEIKNDDSTAHNTHPMPRTNREWNESQPPNSESLIKSFARDEIMMPVKCNLHPWMKMYISVVKNPYFAVTNKAGKYEIKGLPPGDYTLAFVHEKLGEQDQKVTLAAKDSRTVDASFKQ